MNEVEVRRQVAYKIMAELVCCDIYERMNVEAQKGYWDDKKYTYVMPESWHKLKESPDYHDMCYFGGWAAAIASSEPS